MVWVVWASIRRFTCLRHACSLKDLETTVGYGHLTGVPLGLSTRRRPSRVPLYLGASPAHTVTPLELVSARSSSLDSGVWHASGGRLAAQRMTCWTLSICSARQPPIHLSQISFCACLLQCDASLIFTLTLPSHLFSLEAFLLTLRLSPSVFPSFSILQQLYTPSFWPRTSHLSQQPSKPSRTTPTLIQPNLPSPLRPL